LAADLKRHSEVGAPLAKRAEAEKAARADAALVVREVATRLARGESLGKGQRRVYAEHKAAIDAIVPTLKQVFAASARRSGPAK